MRRVALLCVCGCGFQGQGGPSPPPVIDASIDAAPLPAIDAAVDAAIDAAIDAALPAPAFCDPGDPRIIACYPFDGDARDRGGRHLDPMTAEVRFAQGKIGMAMLFGTTSKANLREVSALDVSALTIEAWINPSQLPGDGQRAYVLDNDNQYSLFVLPSGALSCILVDTNTAATTPAGKVVRGEWHHVACTFDGAAARLYVDGALVTSSPGDGMLGTSGQTGLSIAAENPDSTGSRLIGLVDELRLLNVALPAAQLCADAGRASCP